MKIRKYQSAYDFTIHKEQRSNTTSFNEQECKPCNNYRDLAQR